MREIAAVKALSDDVLLRRLGDLVRRSRRVEVDLVVHIGEVDARRLYAREAASSMFDYCRRVLRLRENEAYLRITVARASRELPVLLEMLRDGRLHLSGIARLAPHLTPANRAAVLKRAAGMSHRQIRELVSELEPKPDAPSTIRKLPDRSAARRRPDVHRLPHPVGSPQLGAPRVGPASPALGPGEGTAPGTVPLQSESASTPAPGPTRRAVVEPLAPARYRVQFTASAELREKIERLQALMRSSVPDGDLAKIFDALVTEELERLEAKRFAKTKKPRKNLAETDPTPKSRHIPAPIRRAVYERDGGQCTYVDERDRRCSARHRLEFHHDDPFGRGGRHSLRNVRLMCRTHNALLAERDYGKEVMARFRRVAGRVYEPVAVYASRRPHRVPGNAPG